MSSKKHRGRIQAQGNGLEKSTSWSQDEPITKEEGLDLLERLKSLLNKKEFEEREEQFEAAKRYIEQVEGGVDAIKKKTFKNRKTKNARIDIEILGGTAFLSIIFLAFLLFFLLF